jgi:ABC-type branched-subunit amino acid transport system substrate-binding protein
MATIYASLTLSGPAGDLGRELLQGAEAVMEQAGTAAELVVIDTGGDDRVQRAEDAARQAADDPSALAYLGDVHSDQVAASSRTLGPAGLLQVAPVATWTELGGPTLIRLMPDDAVGASAIGDWLVEAGVAELLVVHDHDPGYGVPVGRMCTEAARARGLAVRSRPVWNHDEELAADVGDAGAVLYAGVAGSSAVGLWESLHDARPDMWLLGTEGVAVAWLAEAISPAAAERTRFFVAPTRPYRSYGEEAMTLILEAVADGGDDREAVVSAARAKHTAPTAYGCLAVVRGRLVSA